MIIAAPPGDREAEQDSAYDLLGHLPDPCSPEKSGVFSGELF
jgi:hypothetical protein